MCEGDGGRSGDERGVGGGLVGVVPVPEVEGKLGEGEDADVCFDGRYVAGDVAAVDGFARLVVEEGVESGGGVGAKAAR